jgi:hypothetical protein
MENQKQKITPLANETSVTLDHPYMKYAKHCMTKCSSFERQDVSDKEKTCLEKCFYDVIENLHVTSLK